MTFLAAIPAGAQEYSRLGTGRLFVNDTIGDGEDRWRSGSYVFSPVFGKRDWSGTRPTGMGEIVEFRLRGEIIAPSNLVRGRASDRRYAGVLSFGAYTHFRRQQTEISLGAEVVVTGPQTQIGNLHGSLHDVLNMEGPGDRVMTNQIPNGFYPTLAAEVGRVFRFSGRAHVRPFVEARAGDETLVRVGADFVIGQFGRDQLMLRDAPSGQLYRGAGDVARGTSFLLGADIARVFDSAYLPSAGWVTLNKSRPRVRAGVQWQGNAGSLFYGLTWLGKEFEQQRDDQFVGSLRLNFSF